VGTYQQCLARPGLKRINLAYPGSLDVLHHLLVVHDIAQHLDLSGFCYRLERDFYGALDPEAEPCRCGHRYDHARLHSRLNWLNWLAQ